jgi:hypothetical protein
MTVDQAESRDQPDLVEEVLRRFGKVATSLPFTRTVGDEFQGLLDDPMSVVTVTLDLMRSATWHIGIGIGGVEQPLPRDSRSARGPAFVAARSAVESAKKELSHVSVRSEPATEEADDAETFLRLVAAIRERRSELGWEAADLMRQGLTQAAAAAKLDITRQALGQRLSAAHWALDQDARPVLGRLLARAEAAATASSQQPPP